MVSNGWLPVQIGPVRHALAEIHLEDREHSPWGAAPRSLLRPCRLLLLVAAFSGVDSAGVGERGAGSNWGARCGLPLGWCGVWGVMRVGPRLHRPAGRPHTLFLGVLPGEALPRIRAR